MFFNKGNSVVSRHLLGHTLTKQIKQLSELTCSSHGSDDHPFRRSHSVISTSTSHLAQDIVWRVNRAPHPPVDEAPPITLKAGKGQMARPTQGQAHRTSSRMKYLTFLTPNLSASALRHGSVPLATVWCVSWAALLVWRYLSNAASFVFYGITCIMRLINLNCCIIHHLWVKHVLNK